MAKRGNIVPAFGHLLAGLETAAPPKSGETLEYIAYEGRLNRVIKYKATAGYLVLKDDKDKPRANIFFVAYVKDPAADAKPAARPITA